MASLTWWTWLWVSCGRWWWTAKPDMLQSMGFQRVGHNWATELNCTDHWFTVLCQFQVYSIVLKYFNRLYTMQSYYEILPYFPLLYNIFLLLNDFIYKGLYHLIPDSYLAPSPALSQMVTTILFSISMNQFLFCYMHLFALLIRFNICDSTKYLSLINFTKHNTY